MNTNPPSPSGDYLSPQLSELIVDCDGENFTRHCAFVRTPLHGPSRTTDGYPLAVFVCPECGGVQRFYQHARHRRIVRLDVRYPAMKRKWWHRLFGAGKIVLILAELGTFITGKF